MVEENLTQNQNEGSEIDDVSNEQLNDTILSELDEEQEEYQELILEREKEQEEFEKSVEELKEELKPLINNFCEICSKTDKITFEQEIKQIYKEYEANHYSALALYCGRVYEYIIYQLGWKVLQNAMYSTMFVNSEPERKRRHTIINEIEGYLTIKAYGHSKTDYSQYFRIYDDKIYSIRNKAAHPKYDGSFSLISKREAEEAIKTLIEAISFLNEKFYQVKQIEKGIEFEIRAIFDRIMPFFSGTIEIQEEILHFKENEDIIKAFIEFFKLIIIEKSWKYQAEFNKLLKENVDIRESLKILKKIYKDLNLKSLDN